MICSAVALRHWFLLHTNSTLSRLIASSIFPRSIDESVPPERYDFAASIARTQCRTGFIVLMNLNIVR